MLVKKRPVGILIRFLIFKHMKKRSNRTSTRSHISMLMKKRPVRVLLALLFSSSWKRGPPDPNSLSHFNPREKKTRWGLNSLSCFQAHEKEVHRTSTRSHISMLVKKRPVGVLLALLFSSSWKRGPPDPNSLSHFQAREKKTRKGLFFNLRLRKTSKPLRERVW